MSRKSTVYVSKEDKELLQKHCEEIEKILKKYPYSNDYSIHFVTTMSRTKNSFNDMKSSIECLEIEQ